MMPKNTLREGILNNKLFIHAGPTHDKANMKLPQFTVPQHGDINELWPLEHYLDPKKAFVAFESHPDEPASELKDHERIIDETIGFNPLLTYKKEYTDPKWNKAQDKFLDRSFNKYRKYRKARK